MKQSRGSFLTLSVTISDEVRSLFFSCPAFLASIMGCQLYLSYGQMMNAPVLTLTPEYSMSWPAAGQNDLHDAQLMDDDHSNLMAKSAQHTDSKQLCTTQNLSIFGHSLGITINEYLVIVGIDSIYVCIHFHSGYLTLWTRAQLIEIYLLYSLYALHAAIKLHFN